MNEWSTGVIVIKERIAHGFFHKKEQYRGHLHNASALSGYSVNTSFKKKYRRGDKVKARYRMLTAESGPKKGEEYIEFEILEAD